MPARHCTATVGYVFHEGSGTDLLRAITVEEVSNTTKTLVRIDCPQPEYKAQTTETATLSNLQTSFPPQRLVFEPRSGHVGFEVDKVALWQALSEYYGFFCQFSSHRLLHTHCHLSFRTGKICQIIADVQSGHSLTLLKKLRPKLDL
jgi:hypothetical protein